MRHVGTEVMVKKLTKPAPPKQSGVHRKGVIFHSIDQCVDAIIVRHRNLDRRKKGPWKPKRYTNKDNFPRLTLYLHRRRCKKGKRRK